VAFTMKTRTKKKMNIKSKTFILPPFTIMFLWVQPLVNLVLNHRYIRMITIYNKSGIICDDFINIL
jgi:hypothetical protein